MNYIGKVSKLLLQQHWPVKKFYFHKIVIIFLFLSLYMCFGCSKEPSYRDGSFEYPQHMFWLRNKKNKFYYTLLPEKPCLRGFPTSKTQTSLLGSTVAQWLSA